MTSLMAHWREEYSAALAARDRHTRLADRTATVAVETRSAEGSGAVESRRAAHSPLTSDSKKQPSTVSGLSPEILNTTRADLAEAQRSRSELQGQLSRVTTELEKLRKRSTYDGRRIDAMESEITHLQLRLKDRDEELRGKAKLLDDFQDELASLNLQLNMAEERKDQLLKENQELVDRWMVRMGKEAEAMNDASKFS